MHLRQSHDPSRTETAATVLGLTRAAAGLAGLLAPRLSGRIMGLDATSAGTARLVMRLFATRDLALGLATLASPAAERGWWLRTTAAIDAADAAAAVAAGARRQVRRSCAFALAATATSAAAYGRAASRR